MVESIVAYASLPFGCRRLRQLLSQSRNWHWLGMSGLVDAVWHLYFVGIYLPSAVLRPSAAGESTRSKLDDCTQVNRAFRPKASGHRRWLRSASSWPLRGIRRRAAGIASCTRMRLKHECAGVLEPAGHVARRRSQREVEPGHFGHIPDPALSPGKIKANASNQGLEVWVFRCRATPANTRKMMWSSSSESKETLLW